MIEADAKISRFISRQREEVLLALAIGGGAFLIAMIPGLLLARSITGGLNKLSAGIRRFQSGEHDVQVHVGSGDELQHLGMVFNEMIISLGEKLALLPYVSRFTAEAVRRSREDPQWLAGMEQEVIVLFADLRGFTSWCETREASFLVRELNRLLAVQADAVVSAGGDVDKFIGDAVMAVFLGGEESAEKVFACARNWSRPFARKSKRRNGRSRSGSASIAAAPWSARSARIRGAISPPSATPSTWPRASAIGRRNGKSW